jgi:hypothetical protein
MAIIVTKEFSGMTDIYKSWNSGGIMNDDALNKLQIEHQRIINMIKDRTTGELYRVDTEDHKSRQEYIDFTRAKIKFFDTMFENYKKEIIAKLDIAPLNSSPPSYKEPPDFMKHLFNAGFISEDGRVLKGLPNTAIEMRMEIRRKISPKELKWSFRKSDGKEFSESQCKKAAQIANSYRLPLDDSENSKKRKPLLANKEHG